MRYKIEAEGADGRWIELVRGEGALAEAQEKAGELAARAHNRDVVGWRISEFADADYSERVAIHPTA
jgi:hypothetical protein